MKKQLINIFGTIVESQSIMTIKADRQNDGNIGSTITLVQDRFTKDEFISNKKPPEVLAEINKQLADINPDNELLTKKIMEIFDEVYDRIKRGGRGIELNDIEKIIRDLINKSSLGAPNDH